MNPYPIRLACFGTWFPAPHLPDWEVGVEVDWPDQALICLSRAVPESEGFLGVFFHLFQDGHFSGLGEFAENFPQLSGQVGLPIERGLCHGLFYQRAIRLDAAPSATRIALDRYTLLQCRNRFAAFIVWCSSGLYERHGLELDSLRGTVLSFLETSKEASNVKMTVA